MISMLTYRRTPLLRETSGSPRPVSRVTCAATLTPIRGCADRGQRGLLRCLRSTQAWNRERNLGTAMVDESGRSRPMPQLHPVKGLRHAMTLPIGTTTAAGNRSCAYAPSGPISAGLSSGMPAAVRRPAHLILRPQGLSGLKPVINDRNRTVQMESRAQELSGDVKNLKRGLIRIVSRDGVIDDEEMVLIQAFNEIEHDLEEKAEDEAFAIALLRRGRESDRVVRLGKQLFGDDDTAA